MNKQILLDKRISKEEYYLGFAREAIKRATCLRRSFGAIVVVDDTMVSVGYTGAPRDTLDCLRRGYCLRNELGIPSGQRYELCASVHAEQNIFINASRTGAKLLGGDMYIFGQKTADQKPIDAFPCFACKKMIVNAGILRVVCGTAEGGFRVFLVKDWVREWQDPNRKITDENAQYGQGLSGFSKNKQDVESLKFELVDDDPSA